MPTRLYYTPTSCGAASFIVAHTAKLEGIECETVDLTSHKTSAGEDFLKVNPKGNVPTVRLDDGTLLNENVACLLYLADAKPEAGLAPAPRTPGRYQLINALAFVATEIHQALGVLFYPTPGAEVTAFLKERAKKKLQTLNDVMLRDEGFLVPDAQFTAADAYCYVTLSWVEGLGLGPLSTWPRAAAYFERVKALPNVQAAHARMAENPKSVM